MERKAKELDTLKQIRINDYLPSANIAQEEILEML